VTLLVFTFKMKHPPLFNIIKSYGDCLEVKREYYQNCFIYRQRAASSMNTVNMLYLGQLINFPSCIVVGITYLNKPPSSFLIFPMWSNFESAKLWKCCTMH